jgi:hypothetical protein
MPSDDRDPKFERALARHLRGGSAEANCPGAETLAAYHERNLSLEEMAQWKQHISACEACQEALALVEATENQITEDWEKREIPVLEAASTPGAHRASTLERSAILSASSAPRPTPTSPVAINRRRPAVLRWAIPLGAVAAGVLVFIGLYERRSPVMRRPLNTEMARNQTPTAPGPILNQLADHVQRQLEPKDEGLQSAEMSRQKTKQAPTPAPLQKPADRGSGAGDTARELRDLTAGGVYMAKKTPARTPAPLAPEIAKQDATGAAISGSARVAAAAPPPAPMAYGGSVGGAAGGPPARGEGRLAVPPGTAQVTVESAAAPDTQTNAMMMKQGASSQSVEVISADIIGLILTPDNKVFWKLEPAGTLQLTTDGGKKWKSLETGVNANLTAGFAPSSHVCWIAGKAGTLLLTTDRGRHWTRISTPISSDLGGVHAADRKHASIWDAANQVSYETSDGGATWKQTSSK